MITDSQIQEYSDKGAILLKKAFNIEWLSLLAEGIEKNRKNPGPHACPVSYTHLRAHET